GYDTRVLVLKYKVKPGVSNGYYSKLMGVDISRYDNIEFFVRGGQNFPGKFTVELKNKKKETSQAHVVNIGQKEWKRITIPLEDFGDLTDLRNMTELVIVFNGDDLGHSHGNILIDDISFTGLPKKESPGLLETSNMDHKDIARLTDDELLDIIERKAFNFFWNETDPETGFIRDRDTIRSPSSIASIGFGLAAICIADARGWIESDQAYDRVRKTLVSIIDKAEQQNGFYYHFIDMNTGQRVWNSEVSSIDTALMLGGVIVAKEYFRKKEITQLADRIYDGIEWAWMLESGSGALYMGWTPETEFDRFILWDMFAEEMLMYIMAIGAEKNPVPAKSWESFDRITKIYRNHAYICCESESMFTYQYSHAFVDFREKHDKYTDYWENSKQAIEAGIDFCGDHKGKYTTYREGFWGISASDGPDGYRNYGATIFTHDGTVSPYAVCAAVPFIPEESISMLRKMLVSYGDRIWSDDYGFVSSFNLDKEWFSDVHIGIDLGISLLMIENYRTGFVWNCFMKNKNIKAGMEAAGFKSGTTRIKSSAASIQAGNKSMFQKEVYALRTNSPHKIEDKDFTYFDTEADLELGHIRNIDDLSARFAFEWDDTYLYFTVEVEDDVVYANRVKEEIYKDDCVELYISSMDSDVLIWGNKDNFQLGFAPDSLDRIPAKYAFFQKMDPEESIRMKVRGKKSGYRIEVAINWEFLNMKPEAGSYIGVSPAVFDSDGLDDKGRKLNWFFKNQPSGIILGRLILK
ncbi:MAG: glucoamylase family protein, partial [Elusimicrobiota bacterium]